MSDQPQTGWVEEFRVEFHDYWRQLPNKGLFFALLAVWLGLFHFLGNSTFGYVNTPSLPGWMWNAWSANDWDEGHGALMPVVVLALLWWKRRELMALPWDCEPGLVLVAVALGASVVMIQQPRLSIIGLFGGICGLMGLAWGWRFCRPVSFPFSVRVCIPFGSLAEKVTFPLRMLVNCLRRHQPGGGV